MNYLLGVSLGCVVAVIAIIYFAGEEDEIELSKPIFIKRKISKK